MAENLIPLEPDKFYHIYNHAIGKENFCVFHLTCVSPDVCFT
jgi:hypothetical protein